MHVNSDHVYLEHLGVRFQIHMKEDYLVHPIWYDSLAQITNINMENLLSVACFSVFQTAHAKYIRNCLSLKSLDLKINTTNDLYLMKHSQKVKVQKVEGNFVTTI